MKKIISTFFCCFLFTLPPLLQAIEIEVPADYKTIQEAIDAAKAHDVIVVSPKVYHERIRLKPQVHVRSKGNNDPGNKGFKRAESVILAGRGKPEDVAGVIMAEGSTLDGFTVTGMGAFDETLWQKHWDEKGMNQSHDDIGHFGVPAISVSGVSCTVANNIVPHNGQTGIAIQGDDPKECSPRILNNTCYRNMGAGIGSMNGSTAVITGNTCFENFYAGIGHNNASPLVTDNDCYNNVRAGIGISNGASPIVRKNRCHGNRRAGIGIRTGKDTRPVVEMNDCYENEMAGIGCTETSAPVLRGNRCHHNKLAGIGCSDHATPVVEGNHCYENRAAGIGAESASPTIVRNRLESNHTAGIGISQQSKAYIAGNKCLENKMVAIGVRDGSEVVLRENVLVRTEGMPPIVAILDGSQAIAMDNQIKGGGVAGVLLQGNLIAIRNRIEGRGRGSGISIGKGSDVTLRDNVITGYRHSMNDQREK